MNVTSAPVREQDRLDFLDILRGFAVMAIFVVNIRAMFASFPYYNNPTLWAGDYDVLVAGFQAFLVEDKWRTVFTALFGAGIALIAERAKARGAASLGMISRRVYFLLIFGLIHLLLIWGGDILTAYAVTGFLVVWFRNAGRRTLFWAAAIALLIALPWNTLFNLGPVFIPEVRAEVEPFLWGSDPAFLEEQTAIALGPISGQIAARIVSAEEYILLYFIAGGHFLEMFATMLFGMWLYRIGFLGGALSAGLYRRVAIIGLGVAVILDSVRWGWLVSSGWTFDSYMMAQLLNQLDGYAGGLGYAALIALFVGAGAKLRPVAAVGRMAFTNYIACSLVGTTLAFGHGGALFGALTNLQLMGVVAATWLAMLVWSPLWLAMFRFGPIEWLWRSLTYGKLQTFRR